MRVIDRSTGAVISDTLANQLKVIKEKLENGSVIDRSDFIAVGIKESVITVSVQKLKNCFDLDVLTITRGRALVGWILADEVL